MKNVPSSPELRLINGARLSAAFRQYTQDEGPVTVRPARRITDRGLGCAQTLPCQPAMTVELPWQALAQKLCPTCLNTGKRVKGSGYDGQRIVQITCSCQAGR